MKNRRRLYGTGSTWLRKSKRFPKGMYWIRFYDSTGRQRAENAHTASESKALKLLAKRTGEVLVGTLPSPNVKRTLVEDLAAAYFKIAAAAAAAKIPEGLPDVTREWRTQRAEKVVEGQQQRWDKQVGPVFADTKAALVAEEDLAAYVTKRLKIGAAHATINREMALLKRMYQIGYKRRPWLVQEIPLFPPKLAESAREGYIEDENFAKLLNAIKEPSLRAMTLVAYRCGFRKGELQNILVMQLNNGRLSLFKGATKNSKPRVVVLPDDVRSALEQCAADKPRDAFLFTWKDGSQIRDFRASWVKATLAAGVPDLLFHDLRRSCVKRMRQKLGIPVATAMKITGHLTRQVFDTYDVSGDSDLVDAAKVL